MGGENHSISRILKKCDVQREEVLDNCQYGNLLCELKTILEIIVRRYNFPKISLVNRYTDPVVQGDYSSVICAVFRAFRSKCTELSIDKIAWPVVRKLQTQLEFSSLDLWFMRDIPKELPCILNTQHLSFSLLPALSADDKFALLHTVIKKWERGECLFKLLTLSSPANYQLEPETRGYMKPERWFDMKCIKVYDGAYSIQFRREMDTRILNVRVLTASLAVSREYYYFTEL